MPSPLDQAAFIARVTPSALAARDEWGILVSLAVAQACLESNYGTQVPAPCNVLGLKDLPFDAGAGPAVGTHEGFSGATTGDSRLSPPAGPVGPSRPEKGSLRPVRAVFEDFRDLTHCFLAYGRLLARSPTYAPYRAALPDVAACARALQAIGYSTDPQYAAKVLALWERQGLVRLDTLP